jgi:CHAT domain-containing protein/tetratricopeptide (TPR) repeat protein
MKYFLLIYLGWLVTMPLQAQNPAVLMQKADLLFQQRQYDASNQLYLKAESGYFNLKKYNEAAFARLNAGYNYEAQDLSKEAIMFWRSGLAKYQDMVSDNIKFEYFANLGNAYLLLGKEDSALFNLDRAALLLNKINLPLMEQAFYNTYGIWHYYRGDFLQAGDYFKVSGKIIAENHCDNDYVAQYASNLGKCYEAMGYLDKALELLHKALNITMKGSDQLKYLRLLNLGQCQQLKGQWIASQKTFDQIEALLASMKKGALKKSVTWDKYFKLYHHQAELQLAQHHVDKAEELFIKAQKIIPAGNNSKQLDLQVGLATVANARHQTDKALGHLQQALISGNKYFNKKDISQNPAIDYQHINSIFNMPQYFDALKLKAQLLQIKSLEVNESDKSKWQELALQTYITAINFAEYIRRNYDQSGSKLYFAQRVFPIYEDAIEQAYILAQRSNNAKYQAMIYQIFQVTKSTVLSDITHESIIKPKTIPGKLLNNEKELKKEIRRMELAGASSENQTVVLDLQSQHYRQLKNYYSKKFEQHFNSLAHTQTTVLDNQTAVLDYFWGKEYLYIFVVTDTKTTLIRQAFSEGVRGSIKDLKYELYAAPPEGYKYKGSNAAKTLYDWLIRPTMSLIEDKKKLIIIRDDDLQYIPFNILEKPNNDPNHFYKYCLVQDYVISYDYSLAIIGNRQETTKKKNRNTLVFAPYSSLNKTGLNNGLRDSTLGPLPSSGQEAKAIGGIPYINGKASKAQFVKVLNEADIIYLLTHAKADTNGRGVIAFYQDGKEFRLFTPELYDLDLSNTQLMVLSACETSIGESRKGEGMMSVARGIAYAGCLSTIMTHWNASDNRTPQITSRFNELLHERNSFAEALQQSQIDYLEKGNAEQHPYYWANMALIGQDQTLDQGFDYWFWILTTMAVLLTILLGFVAVRRKQAA